MSGRRAVALALVGGWAALLGCGNGEAPEAGSPGGKPKAGRKIGMAIPGSAIPFLIACKNGAQAVVKERGDELVVASAEDAVGKLIQDGVACILLSPASLDAAAPAVEKANAAGIPVVAFGTNANDGKVACFVESDDALAGALCADYIGWRLGGQGRVAVVDHPGDESAQERVQFFREHVAEFFPNLEIVATLAGEATKETAQAATAKMLEAHPGIEAIFAVDDASGLGAAQAVKAAKNAKAFVVCIDGAPDAVAELKKPDSPLAMTVAQFPQAIGRVAAEMAYKVLAGETVELHIRLPVMPVTRKNLAAYPTWAGKMPDKIAIPWDSRLQIPRQSE